MRVVTAAQMRTVDARAIKDFHLPANVLLEHAGLHVAKTVWQLLARTTRKRVVLFAGKGNNGGDGFVAARHLRHWGASVRVFAVADEAGLAKPVAQALRGARAFGVDVIVLDEKSERNARLNVAASDVVVDALLGTGMKDKPKSFVAKAIDLINGGNKPVVSVDLPSGIDADTGHAAGASVRATWTVTFGAPKIGLLIGEGRDAAGRIVVADIGLPKQLFATGDYTFVTAPVARHLLPVRPSWGHKGTFGRVLIVAGSRGMTGAALLCVRGAQRVGAGVVTLAGPAPLNDVFAAAIPEALTNPLPSDESDALAVEAADAVERQMKRGADVIVIGPGMTTKAGATAVVERVLQKAAVPVVVDADALNVLAKRSDLLSAVGRDRRAALVLTPHPAEMARLCSIDVQEVLAWPVELVREKAAQWQAVVVLKGSPTVTALPDGKAFINGTGTNALASGGTGDVLAGAIGGLIGQGASPADAAVAAVFVHGLAGDLAAQDAGRAGVVAGDVAHKLPQALERVRTGEVPLNYVESVDATRIF